MGLTVSAKRDPLLDLLLAVAYGVPSHEFSVTLLTSGGTVTGRLVSVDTWLRKKANFIREMDPVVLNGFADAFERYADEATSDREIDEATSKVDDKPARQTLNFIHLANARVVGPTNLIPEGTGMLMRIRLSDVAGWAIGELTPGP